MEYVAYVTDKMCFQVQDLNERITEAENDRTKLEAENAKLLAELTEKVRL